MHRLHRSSNAANGRPAKLARNGPKAVERAIQADLCAFNRSRRGSGLGIFDFGFSMGPRADWRPQSKTGNRKSKTNSSVQIKSSARFRQLAVELALIFGQRYADYIQ